MLVPELLRLFVVAEHFADERFIRKVLEKDDALEVLSARQVSEAAALLAEGNDVDAMLLGVPKGDESIVPVCEQLAREYPHIAIILVAETGSKESAMAAIRAGAQDYLVRSEIERIDYPRAIRVGVARQRHQVELQNSKIHDLGERVRELQGFHAAALVLHQDDRPLAELLERFASLLPATLKYPALAVARVAVGELVGETMGFTRTPWQLECQAETSDGEPIGVAVGYCEEPPDNREDPFLPEERRLLTSLTEMLCAHVETRNALVRLQESESQFRVLFEHNPHPMWVFDLKTLEFLAVNDTAIARYGYSREEFLAMRVTDIRPPEEIPPLLRNIAKEASDFQFDEVWRHRLKDGRIIRAEIYSKAMNFRGRRARLVLAVDCTKRFEVEEALKASEARLRNAQRIASMGSWEYDYVRDRMEWSEEVYRIFGISPDDFVPNHDGWFRHVHPDDQQELTKLLAANLLDRQPISFEHRIVRPDGQVRHVHQRGELAFDGEENVIRASGTVQDITEVKDLENQLSQSRKMEAIGHLAGGVAHDFNNLLTVINGYSELAMTKVTGSEELLPMLAEIRRAGEHAATLTRQLLAFSRKQVLAPQVVDVNAIVGNLEQMLNRLIGEDIHIIAIRRPKVLRIRVDPGQLEQILINLVVNARDAMPQGGRVTIETANVLLNEEQVFRDRDRDLQPGPHVSLTVSDTGCGMDSEVLSHIFEPFFTTKETGRGTGLGLATVFGIVKQSGGAIDVSSEPGKGTRFKILFPAVSEGPMSPEPPEAPPRRGHETVLLVEDEAGVRDIARLSLESQGYHVLEASDGRQALEVFEAWHSEIQLVIADVMMPEMSGRELVQHLRRRHPHLRALFMSGYTDDAIIRHGTLEATDAFLQKPFSPMELASKIREILDRSP